MTPPSRSDLATGDRSDPSATGVGGNSGSDWQPTAKPWSRTPKPDYEAQRAAAASHTASEGKYMYVHLRAFSLMLAELMSNLGAMMEIIIVQL